MKFIHQPTGSPRLGDFLRDNLRKNWPIFRAAIAFVKQAGTRHIAEELKAYSSSGKIELIVGIDHGGTSKEGLEDLLSSVSNGRVIVFHNAIVSTFHPKIYLFRSDQSAEVLIGSGNLTEGGLFTNYEAAVQLSLDLNLDEHRKFLKDVEDALDEWTDLGSGTAHLLDADFLKKLVANGYVPVEALAAPEGAETRWSIGRDEEGEDGEFERLFLGRNVPRAPAKGGIAKKLVDLASAIAGSSQEHLPQVSLPARGFVMTLHQTDAGVGQTTAGTSKRSPELFIPLAARNAESAFWGWDDLFAEDSAKPGKFDRLAVQMQVGGNTVLVNMMTWPDKHDFRLRSEALRSGGTVGSIIVIERADAEAAFDYVVQFIPPGTTLYPVFHNLCVNSVRNSQKRWGYY